MFRRMQAFVLLSTAIVSWSLPDGEPREAVCGAGRPCGDDLDTSDTSSLLAGAPCPLSRSQQGQGPESTQPTPKTLGSAASVAETGTLYVVRHAERDSSTKACINQKGQKRAETLPSVFTGEMEPKAIFAYSYNEEGHCERCIQTATPLANSLNLVLNHSFPRPGENCNPVCPPGLHHDKEAAAMKEALTETNGGPVVAVWESMNIWYLLKNLGVPAPPAWPFGLPHCKEWDRMYKVTFTRDPEAKDGWAYSDLVSTTEGLGCIELD